MIHNIKEYCTQIVKDKNLMVYSNNDLRKFTKIFDLFHSYKICDITEFSLDKLGAYIVTNSIDALLIDISTDTSKIYDILQSLNHKVSVMLYINASCKETHPGLLNMSEVLIAEPFDENTLMYKFFTMLNSESAISAINSASNSMSELVKINTNQLEDYLDTYEGKVLFLSESLQSNLELLESGELNTELLNAVSKQMDEVGDVFSNHFYTKKVTPIFTELSSYLKTLNLNEIAIENLEGFEYLSRIIEDINTYMIEYFVDRVFADVYVFQDSLKNSIQFMQDRLFNVKDESSELEFF